jgi:hypothetical protein
MGVYSRAAGQKHFLRVSAQRLQGPQDATKMLLKVYLVAPCALGAWRLEGLAGAALKPGESAIGQQPWEKLGPAPNEWLAQLHWHSHCNVTANLAMQLLLQEQYHVTQIKNIGNGLAGWVPPPRFRS